MSKDISPCPFCGGKAKLSFKDVAFYGQNALGDKKIKYRVQVICNRCHSRGNPIKTDWLINPNPNFTEWGLHRYIQRHPQQEKENTEMFAPYVQKAIEAWNSRKEQCE